MTAPSAGPGFDRRDFAPPGTKFPLTPPDPDDQRRGPRIPGWLRWAALTLLGIGLVVLGAVTLFGGDDNGPVVVPSPTAPATGETSGDGAVATAESASVTEPAGTTVPAELQGAAGFAVQFANSYLNYDADNAENRLRELASYTAPGLDPQLGWSAEGRQIAALTVPLHAVRRRDDTVLVTVASQVTGADAPRWVHLAVPLAADAQGRWAVIGPPAFVPRPSPGNPVLPDPPGADPALSASLRDEVAALFTAYGAETAVALTGVTAERSDIRGLGGAFAFNELVDLAVHVGDDDARTAVATVRWDNEVTGGSLTQTYRLTLLAAEGSWRISTVTAG